MAAGSVMGLPLTSSTAPIASSGDAQCFGEVVEVDPAFCAHVEHPPKISSCPRTSRSSGCRHALPNSTRWKTSGSTCAAIDSRSQSSVTMTISSTKPAPPGYSSPAILIASLPSRPDHGQRSMLRAVGMRRPIFPLHRGRHPHMARLGRAPRPAIGLV
jgi:hypothetical protein